MRLVNQMAEADVKSMEGMLGAHPATIGAADATSSELPAGRLRLVTQYIRENLQRKLRLGAQCPRAHAPLPFRAPLQAKHRHAPA